MSRRIIQRICTATEVGLVSTIGLLSCEIPNHRTRRRDSNLPPCSSRRAGRRLAEPGNRTKTKMFNKTPGPKHFIGFVFATPIDPVRFSMYRPGLAWSAVLPTDFTENPKRVEIRVHPTFSVPGNHCQRNPNCSPPCLGCCHPSKDQRAMV